MKAVGIKHHLFFITIVNKLYTDYQVINLVITFKSLGNVSQSLYRQIHYTPFLCPLVLSPSATSAATLTFLNQLHNSQTLQFQFHSSVDPMDLSPFTPNRTFTRPLALHTQK
jgi:hypothetical protein